MRTDKIAFSGLYQLFSNEDPGVYSDNSDTLLLPSGQELSITTKIVKVEQRNGKWISPTEFYVRLDGDHQPEFDYCSIGMERSREDAERMAVDEWLEAFGRSFVNTTVGGERGIEQYGSTIYPGSISYKGRFPGGWLDGSPEMHQKLFSGIIPPLKNNSYFYFNGFRTQTVNLLLVIYNQVVSCVECSLNGEVSHDINNAFEDLDWPSIYAPYILKQYYIVVYNKLR